MRTRDNNYIPDILETIANLSNDEVFTPPKLANDILDLLPKEIWKDSTVTFLDPAVKTGIFLREIARRLIEGLADEIPDLQKRVNHILTKQVFGLAITELTALMSRRTVYCAMEANSPLSVCTEFTDAIGNIKFPDTEHTWDKNGKCEYCGANKTNYSRGADRESYAYPFLHNFNIKETFGDMKFDVIIGNPPYQLSVGNTGANSSYAPAIYHLFVDKSREMNPKYITMIVPSRWMTNNAEGISEKWVKELIESNKFKIIHDYENADNLFNGVGIIGGVNYFLWDRDHSGSCDYHYHYEDGGTEKWQGKLNIFSEDIVVRNPSFHSIIKKVSKIHGNYYKKEDDNFSSLVSSSHFFDKGGVMGSGWRDYSIEKDKINNIKYYVSKSTNNVEYGWVSEGQIPKNREAVRLNKVLIPAAHGGQSQVLGYPRYAEKNSVSSQTYLVIGYDYRKHNLTEKECFNIISYIKTKFFRFMVKIRKVTQNGARGVYQFVPLQDFSKPWTDAELYKKYGLTEEEIAYIEENIAPMTDDTTVSEEDTQKTT